MSTPYTGKKPMHRHRDLIIAWANGATIEGTSPSRGIDWWMVEENPDWANTEVEYRIKPVPNPIKVKEPMHIYYSKSESKVWIDANPPEKFMYNNLYTYVGEIEVLR